MKIQYCSDLHLEFPENKSFMERNPLKVEGEILLLAGDIIPFALLDKPNNFFDFVSDKFSAVYWIPGNHEYYHYDLARKSSPLNEKIRKNVFLVNNTEVEHKGVKLIFSTLWSKISPGNTWKIQNSISDFFLIKMNHKLFTPFDFSNLHEESFAFLKTAVKKNKSDKTLIVTHHIPTLMNYPAMYKGDSLNEAFAVELFDFIEKAGADYWLYGHHHANIPEFTVGKTKLITNQLGYVRQNEHRTFKNDAIVEV